MVLEEKLGYESELLDEIISKCKVESGRELEPQNIDLDHKICLSSYKISTDEESVAYGKEKGQYDIFSIPNPLELEGLIKEYLAEKISNRLGGLLGKVFPSDSVLVVGLGNRHISSDSLGTLVCKKIGITLGLKGYPNVMAFCPSVLGLTGIETYDIVRGVVDRVKPTHLIIIDSLCASSSSRLGKSIQLSNTGLCPGSGIGNKRKCIDKTLAKSVVSVGVPLLIYASTFLEDGFTQSGIDLDTIDSIMQSVEKLPNNGEIMSFVKAVKRVYNEDVGGIIVSHKDIGEMVDILSGILADAINKTLGVFELKK